LIKRTVLPYDQETEGGLLFASFARKGFRPVDALVALRALLANPDDTAQVFKIISALSGGARQRVLRRLRGTPVGERLLREQKALAPVLEDRAHLRTLPEGSLGRAYLGFCERHGITASGLIAASEQGAANDQYTWDEGLVHARMRDAHDLWHVVTGYEADLLGEASVLAFTVAQTRNPAIGLIVLAAYFSGHGDQTIKRKLLVEAFARGVRAAWFPAVDWEALLARPLSDVRRELGIGAPPRYDPVWSGDVVGDLPSAPPLTSRAA
jgi:ubiquinone biosynthesis protein COQ4